jgi:ATP-dependent protease ClpP protease subunit
MPATKKDPTTEALEQEKLRLEIDKLRIDVRHAESLARSVEIAASRDHENWITRANGQRVLHFNDQVYSDSVAYCMTRLRDMLDIDAAAPIEIVLNSPGGSVLDGFELYDFILALRAEGARIDTTIMGMAASMAGVIAQAGEVRRIGPSSLVMIHEVGSISYGKLSSLKDHVKLADRLYDRCIGILASRAKLTPEAIKERADRKDWWLNSDEALEHGFVDLVLPVPTTQVS